MHGKDIDIHLLQRQAQEEGEGDWTVSSSKVGDVAEPVGTAVVWPICQRKGAFDRPQRQQLLQAMFVHQSGHFLHGGIMGGEHLHHLAQRTCLLELPLNFGEIAVVNVGLASTKVEHVQHGRRILQNLFVIKLCTSFHQIFQIETGATLVRGPGFATRITTSPVTKTVISSVNRIVIRIAEDSGPPLLFGSLVR